MVRSSRCQTSIGPALRAARTRTDLALVCLVAGFVLASLLPAAQAAAQAGPKFELTVIVANLSQEKSGVDKGAKRLHKELKSQFRYEGIRVLEETVVTLQGDEVLDMKLPTLRRLRIRPLVIEKQSALISVEVSGLVSTDLKIKRGQLVIIGAERFRDGRLVIALEGED